MRRTNWNEYAVLTGIKVSVSIQSLKRVILLRKVLGYGHYEYGRVELWVVIRCVCPANWVRKRAYSTFFCLIPRKIRFIKV